MHENLSSIKATLKKIIVKDLEVDLDEQQINEDVSLYDDGLGLDSIVIVNFIVLIEKEFDIRFSETEISAKIFGNIRSLADFIHGKLQAV